jgi:hypothetical protein
MKIKSEKQSSKLCEPGAESYSVPLRFDPEKYRKYLPENDWSETAQDEYLNTLWNIMSAFVNSLGAPILFRPFQKRRVPFRPKTVGLWPKGFRTLINPVTR